MADVNWNCLAVHAVVTVLTFFVVNYFWLYKKDENKVQPDIKVNDYNLYGSLILSFLVGYLVILYMKMDCVNYPTEEETTKKNKEDFLISRKNCESWFWRSKWMCR